MSFSSVSMDKVTAPKPYFLSMTCRLGSTSKLDKISVGWEKLQWNSTGLRFVNLVSLFREKSS